MITKNIVVDNRYYDSVVLMNAAGKIKEAVGARQVSLMMGTDANKELLGTLGLLTPEGQAANPGDLIVAIKADSPDALQAAIPALEEALAPAAAGDDDAYNPRSLDGAMEMLPGINLAVVSIPGEYGEWEVDKLLDRGIHVMLFSDNVPLEAEIALKKKGQRLGLLVMGPDCGTSIIGGVALGFANRVRRGNIGMVAAAGTGIQEVSTLIHKMGSGISHAIGTGGRDLSKDVGGITMKMGIEALLCDPGTDVLVLVSKPPHPDVEKEIYGLLKGSKKPVIINFLGSDGKEAQAMGFHFSPTMEGAALMAVEAAGGRGSLPLPAGLKEMAQKEAARLSPGQKYMRGLYSGGTLANETRLILEAEGFHIWSNVTKDPNSKMKDPFHSARHTLVDMGDDIFTKGAPHPMIDQTKRIDRILEEAADPETAVILLDLVLGYGAHPGPAAELAMTIEKARHAASEAGRHIVFAASVCGVPEDPQDSEKERKIMEDAGVLVFPSNASATRFVREMLGVISARSPQEAGRS
jgi:FdrA protein